MSTEQSTPDTGVAGRWLALAALAVSMLTIGLDATILNVAVPTLATDLRATTGQLQWFTASYTLVLGALIIPMGSLGDRIGRKRVLLLGLAVFGAASVACAFASSAEVLIVMRAVQGIGGAAMMPMSLAMLSVLFQDPVERTRAMGIWVTSNAVGLPLGPILGGWLLNHYHWGAVFLVNVPLVVIGLICLTMYLPESRSQHTRRFDLPGIALSSVGLVALTYGFIQAGQDGWTDPGVLGPIGGGVVLVGAFFAWQRRCTHPLVDTSLFASREFSVGTVLATFSNFALFGLLFVMPQYFQDIGGADPLGTGVRLLPMIGGMVVATRIGPRVVRQLGPRVVLIGGFALIAASLGAAATTDVGTPYAFAAGWITVLGAGIGLVLPASMGAAMGALSMERAGSGSGLLQALRQVGGTIGVALLGTALSSDYHHRLDRGDIPSSVEEQVRASVGGGIAAARQLDSAELADTVRAAFVHAMDTMLVISALLALTAALIAALLLPRRGVARDTAATAPAAGEPVRGS